MIGIIFIAPPAAGKGTQSDMIRKKYGFEYIGTGDILRKAALEENIEALYIQEEMENGELVDDDLIVDLFEKELSLLNGKNFIIDGFPRNLNQAYKLDMMLEKKGIKKLFVFHIDVPYDTVKTRIIGRLICSNCKTVYNSLIDALKPKNSDICDKCNVKLIKRDDDTESTFSRRFEFYEKETKPLIDYYNDKGYLYHINGSLGSNEIFNQIDVILKGYIEND